MSDTVQIGAGRSARTTYSLRQISIVPTRRTRSSKDVDTTWHIDAYSFDVPFVSHPTDALGSVEFAAEFGRQGGLGVINAEGLLGRSADYEQAVGSIAELISAGKITEAITRLQDLSAQPIDLDLLSERISQLRATGQTVAVRVSPQHARELADTVIKAGTEILIVEGSIISAQHVQTTEEPLDLKDFIGGLDVPVIAGRVSDYATATHLMRTGAAGVIVGSLNNGEFVDQVLGIGTGLATALSDVSAARRDYLDETGGRYVHIIADDGEILTSADANKAIACGADAVMLGPSLAIADEAPGKGCYWGPSVGHPTLPRGLTEIELTKLTDSVDLHTLLHGPAHSVDGTINFAGALARAMAKCGYETIKQFQKAPLTVSRGF